MKVIYFVRHGESQANADGLLAGAKTNSPLTESGRRQSHELAQVLRSKKVELIVSSPLERAAKTAEIIAHDIGYDGKIVEEALFTERDFGGATGMPKAKGHSMLDDGTATDAEQLAEFAERAQRALDWLQAQPEMHILVVSHAGFGQMLGTVAAGGQPEDFLKHYHPSNGDVFELALE